ncbi:MAG: hypothetical protein ACE366_01160 [Bradymonadia bacterium]
MSIASSFASVVRQMTARSVTACCAAGLMSVALFSGGCGTETTGDPPLVDALYFPLGIAAHPDGRYLYVANSGFDRRYNAGTVTVYDTFERRILENATVRIGLFAGEISVHRTADDTVQLLVPTRDDDRLVVIQVDAEAGDAQDHLQCDQGSDTTCGAGASIERMLGMNQSDRLSGDPYGLSLDAEGLYMTHLERGVLSRWHFTEDGTPVGDCTVTLPNGASSVARHPTLGWAYVTDRFGQAMHSVETLDPLDRGRRGFTSRDVCRMEIRDVIGLDDTITGGRTRGIAFSADGTLMYVASATEGALRVYDTSVDRFGQPRNRLVAAIPLGTGPNVVRVAGLRGGSSPEVRPAGGRTQGLIDEIVDARGEGLVYISSFTDDLVVVVDPTTLSVVARIPVDRGPHEISFLPDADGRLMAYVGAFQESRMMVVDVDPDSADRFTVKASLQ